MVGINKKGKMSIIDIIAITENIFPDWWCEVSLKEEVICRINLANSDLFVGLIRQIVTYLPD